MTGLDPVDEPHTPTNYELPVGKPAPGEWAADGLCKNHPTPEIWFPARGESTHEAKLICRMCPVQTECLQHAIRYGEKHGIWGGRSERERRGFRRFTRGAA